MENYSVTNDEEELGSKAYRNLKLMVHCPKSFLEFSMIERENLPTSKVLLDQIQTQQADLLMRVRGFKVLTKRLVKEMQQREQGYYFSID